VEGGMELEGGGGWRGRWGVGRGSVRAAGEKRM